MKNLKIKWIGVAFILLIALNLGLFFITSLLFKLVIGVIGGFLIGHVCSICYLIEKGW